MSGEPEITPWSEIDDPIHQWFNLTYANYLTLPRSVLQSMPVEWQRRLVVLLDELQAVCSDHGVELPATKVSGRDNQGRFVSDQLADYERGRRRLFDFPEGAPS